ncbi:MAG: ABC transporter permease subunit [Verrucomicrobiales bacterium]|nr:ABC transporter permease subunit [Verrucomicrobiales bacterium]
MSPWIRKEVRMLLPNVVLIVVLLLLVKLVPRQFGQGVSFGLVGIPLMMVCPILAILMVIGAFGREISPNMIGQFLSQPISRARVWGLKALLLACFTMLLWWGWWQVFQFHFTVNHTPAELAALQVRTPLLAAALLSGGLWAILITRSTITAFWIAALGPTVPIMFSESFLEGRVTNSEAYVTALLAVYVVACLSSAFRLFLRLEHRGSPLEVITMIDASKPGPRLPAWFAEFCHRRPGMTLWCKELRMHRGFLTFIPWNLVAHLAVIALRSSIDLSRNATAELACTYYWVSWLVLPVLMGCHMISEERRLGTWESQLTLPYPRSTQVAIKVIVMVVITLLAGSILPIALERNQLFSESRFDPMSLIQERAQLESEGGFSRWALLFAQGVQSLPFHPEPLVELALVSLGLLTLSVFASSMSRSVMHAVSTTAFCLLMALAMSLALAYQPAPWMLDAIRSPLAVILIVSTLVASMWWRSVRNSYRVEVGPELWKRNGLTLGVALVGSIALSSLIYHRAWERITPLENPHGTAQFKIEENIQIDAQWRALTFTAADGRSWSANHETPLPKLWDRYFGHYVVGSLTQPILPVGGSNWAQVVHAALDVVGIQKDGSLWVSAEPQLQHTSARSTQPHPSAPVRMVRFGKDRDWKQAVPYRSGVLLLASNGTLWVWQKAKLGAVREYQGLSHEVPSEISAHQDWTDLRKTSEGWGYGFQLLRKDGSAWVHPHENPPMADRIKLDDTTELGRAFYLDSGRAPRHTTAWSESDPTGPFKVGIQPNGQLEIVAAWQSSHNGRRWSYKPANIPIDGETKSHWIDVASGGDRGTLISLRADGTLWKWRFPKSPVEAPESAKAKQVGIHSDWVALASVGREILTLAGDGSLWAWRFESPFGTGDQGLLAPSSRPRLLGNILAGSR